MQRKSPNRLRPRAKDLFGQVPVTVPEIVQWVKAMAPHIAHSAWRIQNYASGYKVAEKIRQAKIDGSFWKIESKEPDPMGLAFGIGLHAGNFASEIIPTGQARSIPSPSAPLRAPLGKN